MERLHRESQCCQCALNSFKLSVSRKAVDPVVEFTTPIVHLTVATRELTMRHRQRGTIYKTLNYKNSFAQFSSSLRLLLVDHKLFESAKVIYVHSCYVVVQPCNAYS